MNNSASFGVKLKAWFDEEASLYIALSSLCGLFVVIIYLIILTIWICNTHRKQKIVPEKQIKPKRIENLTKSHQSFNNKNSFVDYNNTRPEANYSGDEIDMHSERFEIESQFSFDFKKPKKMELTDVNEVRHAQSFNKKANFQNRRKTSNKLPLPQHTPKTSVSSVLSLDNDYVTYMNSKANNTGSNQKINNFFKNSKTVEKSKDDYLKIARQLRRPSPDE